MAEKTLPRKVGKRIRDRIRKIPVDVSSRLTSSFGSPISQMVEFHYRGRPMSFSYLGPIETISIDVLHNNKELEVQKDKNDKEIEHFDSTKRRLDESDIFLHCSCGTKIKTKIPTDMIGSKERIMKGLPRSVVRDIISHHSTEEHSISVDHIEVNTEVIPEKERIKNFSPERVNFYRTFSKKTTEVRYLVSYGQDLLAEAPQYKYSESTQGKKQIDWQNMMFMFFIFGLMELFTYLASVASVQQNYFAARPDMFPWYVLVAVVTILISLMWRIHIYDIGRTMVKYVDLRAAPFYISNRGVLPVIMVNSTLTEVWDYQARMMKIDPAEAKDIFHTLTMWNDTQLGELYRANKLGQFEQELIIINSEIKDIQKTEYEFRNEMEKEKNSWRNTIYAVAVTVFVYSFIIMFLNFLGVSV